MKRIKKQKDIEHQHQSMLVKWFRIQYPREKDCLFAIPNGAVLCDLPPERRLRRFNYLCAEGFKAGVSDLFLASPKGDFFGLWLEMKAPNKTASAVSTEQWEHIELMRAKGYAAHWASGFEQAQKIITDYMRLKDGNTRQEPRQQGASDSSSGIGQAIKISRKA